MSSNLEVLEVDVLKLTPADRSRPVIYFLHPGAEQEAQATVVSSEIKSELEARLAEFERNPEAGYSWDQVKAQLKNGSWRTT